MPLTPERVTTLDRTKMTTFYRQRFANAADFTFFMAGAFKVDDALPLLARYVGSLPSTGQQTSRVVDLGIHFPDKNQVVRVDKGREPRAQTVISFFADPPPTPLEQEYVIAATTVLDIALRDALARGARPDLHRRRRLVAAAAAARGRAHPGAVRRGAGKRGGDDRPRDRGDQAAAERRALGRSHQPREGIGAADLRDIAARKRILASPDEHRSTCSAGTSPTSSRAIERIDSITPQILQEVFKKDFPFDRYTVVTLMPEGRVGAGIRYGQLGHRNGTYDARPPTRSRASCHMECSTVSVTSGTSFVECQTRARMRMSRILGRIDMMPEQMSAQPEQIGADAHPPQTRTELQAWVRGPPQAAAARRGGTAAGHRGGLLPPRAVVAGIQARSDSGACRRALPTRWRA